MDLLDMIRLRNIFGPSQYGESDPAETMQSMQLDNPINQTSNVTPEMSMTQPYNYQPEHAMLDRETEMLNNFPQRGNPGFLRKIFASMYGGANGPEAAEHYAQGPYYEKLADWKAQFGPVNQAATQERYANTNERQMATSQANQDRLERALLLREKQGDTRLDQGQQRIDETAEKNTKQADLNERKFKLQQELANGGKLEKDDQGNTYLLNRKGERINVNEEFDNLSFEEKENIKGKWAVKRAGEVAKVRDDNKRHRVVKGTFDDPDNPGKTIYGSLDLDTGEVTPAVIKGSTTRPEAAGVEPNTAREVSGDLDNKARQLTFDHPEWAQYIKFSPTGRFLRVTPPSILHPFGIDQKTYEDINSALGTSGPTNKAAAGLPGAKTSSQSTAQIPKGYKPDDIIRVRRKSDKQTGSIKFSDFNSQKYEMLSQ